MDDDIRQGAVPCRAGVTTVRPRGGTMILEVLEAQPWGLWLVPSPARAPEPPGTESRARDGALSGLHDPTPASHAGEAAPWGLHCSPEPQPHSAGGQGSGLHGGPRAQGRHRVGAGQGGQKEPCLPMLRSLGAGPPGSSALRGHPSPACGAAASHPGPTPLKPGRRGRAGTSGRRPCSNLSSHSCR